MVCPSIYKMMMKVVPTSPAAICAMTCMCMQAPMEHFVGDVGQHQARCVGDAHDAVRQDDRRGTDDGDDAKRRGNFLCCGGKVVSLGVVPCVFVTEGGPAQASMVPPPAMNHVFEKAPGQSAKHSCSNGGTDHDVTVARLQMLPVILACRGHHGRARDASEGAMFRAEKGFDTAPFAQNLPSFPQR